MNKIPPQKGVKEQGAGSLGALEHRYGSSKKLAQEATKVALQKATDQKSLNPGKTATGQLADPVAIDPVTMGMQQSQTTM
jgi:hypothetical protein